MASISNERLREMEEEMDRFEAEIEGPGGIGDGGRGDATFTLGASTFDRVQAQLSAIRKDMAGPKSDPDSRDSGVNQFGDEDLRQQPRAGRKRKMEAQEEEEFHDIDERPGRPQGPRIAAPPPPPPPPPSGSGPPGTAGPAQNMFAPPPPPPPEQEGGLQHQRFAPPPPPPRPAFMPPQLRHRPPRPPFPPRPPGTMGGPPRPMGGPMGPTGPPHHGGQFGGPPGPHRPPMMGGPPGPHMGPPGPHMGGPMAPQPRPQQMGPPGQMAGPVGPMPGPMSGPIGPVPPGMGGPPGQFMSPSIEAGPSPAHISATSTVEQPKVIYAAAPVITVDRTKEDKKKKKKKKKKADGTAEDGSEEGQGTEDKTSSSKEKVRGDSSFTDMDVAPENTMVGGIVTAGNLQAVGQLPGMMDPMMMAQMGGMPGMPGMPVATGEMSAQPGSKKEKKKKEKKFLRHAASTTWEDPTLAEWAPDDFRMFCGDLGNEVTDETLVRAFNKYPSFLKAKVVRDRRTNKTKGYGFVSFKDPVDFTRAMREMNGKYVGNRPIKLRKSAWRDRNLEIVRKKDKEKKRLGLK